MKDRIIAIAAIALALFAAQPAQAASQHVVFAGGCFWGVQAVFESLRGVTATTAGFSGGAAATAHYEIVGTGMTGHAESVDVSYDPSVISFRQLLDVYFLVAHDPTELNRQGPDDGTQYRSEIFYTSESQHRQAAQYIGDLTRRHVFHAPIVTKMEPLRGFYRAEDYHQDFLVHNPENPYIVDNDIPKVKTLVQKFHALVSTGAPAVRAAMRA
ncbi:MAG: peptide-methionine (S)-S-oxide reductase MsrA [Candidatus Eremiobacteraeota bacterium]|nr:peptide-methionine (S)-S-oxide reductase MsrA [Candidatus Eremiobacteraeota bacterium]